MFGEVEVLAGKTLEFFGLDVTWQADSHPASAEFEAKCVVRCRDCGEEFTRPWRLRHQRHQCKRWLRHNPVFASGDVRCREVRDVPVRLECRLVHPDAQLPCRKRVTDAGHDIASVVDVVVPPHGAANVDTGVVVVAPEGWYITIEGRSSMWMRGVAPCRGIIDAGYTGPLMVAMMNVSDAPYHINKGDRIAQIILHKIQHFDLAVVADFSPEYCIRGTSGFGSSGR